MAEITLIFRDVDSEQFGISGWRYMSGDCLRLTQVS